ncbi:hypothetical protein DRJ48_05030 [Candidatus Woesearchaeota archaeon]|nr:MAG: hypothetical protein DRJ48_05030 [Candidatus Woesearchaeota archaeon]
MFKMRGTQKLKLEWLCIAVSLLLVSACSSGNQIDLSCKDCNVVFITFDVLRARSLPCYGYYRNTAPFICGLRNHGIIFKNTFSPAPNTLPAHISLMTGFNPPHHGVLIPYRDKLPHNITILPKLLTEHGYETVWVGNLYIPQLPFETYKPAFTQVAGTDWDSGLRWLESNSDKKFFISFYSDSLHSPYTPHKETVVRLLRDELETKPYLNKLVNGIVYNESELEYLAILNITRNPAKYFPQEYLANYSDILYSGNASLIKQFLKKIYFRGVSWEEIYRRVISLYNIRNSIYWSQFNKSDPKGLELVKTLYEAEILEADSLVKEVFQVLKQKGLLNRTIVIITSDHGEEFYEHGRRDHNQLYDEILHVPLIIYHPRFNGRIVVNYLVQLIDLFPTVFSMIGIEHPEVEGKNLLPYLNNRIREPNEYVYAGPWDDTIAIRTTNWKYISRKNGTRELYFLRNDSNEKFNLIDKYPDIAENLNSELEKYFSTAVKHTGEFPTWINESKRKKLIKTGYW